MPIDGLRESRPSSSPPAVTGSPDSRVVPPAEAHGSFATTLARLGHELERGEAATRNILTGTTGRDSAELLLLQASIYRYSEVVDLASRLVDRAAYGVKTVLGGGGGG